MQYHFILHCLHQRRSQAECHPNPQWKIVSPHTKQGTPCCPCILGFLSSLSTGVAPSQKPDNEWPAGSQYIPPRFIRFSVLSSHLTRVHCPPSFRNSQFELKPSPKCLLSYSGSQGLSLSLSHFWQPRKLLTGCNFIFWHRRPVSPQKWIDSKPPIFYQTRRSKKKLNYSKPNFPPAKIKA